MAAWFRQAFFLAVLAIPMTAIAVARADLPGSIPLSATGDGHLWWVVRNAPEEPRPGQRVTAAATARESYALMHHASDEPAPTERLVMRFAEEPLAIAAEGARVVVLSRGERDGDGGSIPFIISFFAAKNDAVGHWFTVPRTAPLVLEQLPVQGEVRAVAVAGDELAVLLRRGRTDPRQPDQWWFGVLPCESGADGGWRESPLPPLDPVEPLQFFAIDGALAAVGTRMPERGAVHDGTAGPALAMVTRGRDGAWATQLLRRGAERVAPRAVLGGFAIGSIPVVVERTAGGSIRTAIVRAGELQAWAEFPEPARAWSLGAFGPRAVLLELGERGRGLTTTLSLTASEPEPAARLEPPGFASGGWLHIPILAVCSMALVLAAVIFGSDAYLDRQLRAGDRESAPGRPRRIPRTARGAPLGRRGLGMLIDLAPGLLVVWAVRGGSLLELLVLPVLEPNLERALPGFIVLGLGWLFATVGDLAAGRSLGKAVVGLRITGARGGPASFGRRFARSLASIVTVMNPIVMLLAKLHPKGDGPAEMLTGTAVVDQTIPDLLQQLADEQAIGDRDVGDGDDAEGVDAGEGTTGVRRGPAGDRNPRTPPKG